jgi:ABC-2 type transport system ATP-binding protein
MTHQLFSDDRKNASPVLSVQNLVKRYSPTLTAVDGLSFDVKQGICFGLLGPNGAGKTTTIEIMEGILEPTSGQILYKGSPVGAHYRDEIGIQFQQTSLPDFLKVREVIKLFSKFYKRSVSIDALIKDCQLEEFLDREPRKLSGGQRQRVLLALALVNDPEVIFLDEPTTGLDPQARRHFWSLVQSIKARGKTLILTTHYMDEAEVLCDEIAIVDKGKLLEYGTPKALLAQHFNGAVVELPFSSLGESGLSVIDQLGLTHRMLGDRVEIDARAVNKTLQEFISRGIQLENLTIKAPTLEDLFLKLTGRGLRT